MIYLKKKFDNPEPLAKTQYCQFHKLSAGV